ncbi:MAG: hypothetical protein KA160_00135 [Lacibacter sp.]|jgi:hypothetical protein|nr:hypothetical protein [Lacibacter sp.]
MEKQVMAITRNLLNSGAFNHLSDAALTRLQWLLMGQLNTNRANQLMQYWYSGNYYSEGVPQYLFHNCNMMLLHAGKPAIDLFVADEMDA